MPKEDDPIAPATGEDALLLDGGTVITMNARREILSSGAVHVRGDRIADVGRSADLRARYPASRVIDCAGRVVIPGLINTHTHLFQTLLKGVGDDLPRSDWSARGVRASAALLQPEDVYAAARHGALESIHSGVTTLVDFAYGTPRRPMTEPVVRALAETGIRGVVGRTLVTARSEDLAALREDADEALADAERLIDSWNAPGARVRVALAPSMIWGVDRETIERSRRLADEKRVVLMMHVAETRADVEYALRSTGMREVPFLESIGALQGGLLAVHCVHCDEGDLRILARKGVAVSHNPCSNLYLGAGVAPVAAMLRYGIVVSLGTDGAASNNDLNLMQALKLAALVQKGWSEDGAAVSAEQALEMATVNGAAALGMSAELGSIEPGKKADLVVLRMDGFSVTPMHHPVSAIVYSSLGDEAELVLVDGAVVMSEGRVTTASEEDVRAQAERAAKDLLRRAGVDAWRQRSWPVRA